MKSLRLALIAATILATLPLAALHAQPTPAVPSGQAAPATQQALQVPAFTEADARAVLNGRLAAIRTVLELSPEQERLWPPVEMAIRDIVRGAGERRARGTSAAAPAHFLDVLNGIANAEETRARELRRFVSAAKPLADSLTEAQRRRVPAFLGMDDTGGPHQPSAQLWLFEEEG
ncbi:hypothetical protein D9599_29555 [Roseomonas sp. KE2513]|uniref:hypothetical protein n=1 Tax=Roseomonas sp. KE2513 TaxID=2479202 RepID=UPI0018E04916|nr:hypothetical protein [Roseomonas sp. KE2513]MBI0539652.1 hypothetical protein [Roseomonas sp. KE2513]